ncbi:MAG: hypothetical protein Q9160_001786 [Pyrenula sp. 1 TL-2023]
MSESVQSESGTTSFFKYEPLSEPAHQLRLLQVNFDKWSGDLDCTLSTWQKTEAPEYIAISYTWGDPAATTSLALNGKRKQVRQNCSYALRQLWSHHRSHYCWIDSISIDQSNNDEKGVQVAMMADIYEGAVLVLACIGPASDDSGFFMHFLHGLKVLRDLEAFDGLADFPGLMGLPSLGTQEPSDRDKHNMNDNRNRDGIRRKLIDLVSLVGPDPDAPVLQSLMSAVINVFSFLRNRIQRVPLKDDYETWFKRLLKSMLAVTRRPYFSRLWIVQEIFMARSIHLCCGKWLVDAKEFLYMIAPENPATSGNGLSAGFMAFTGASDYDMSSDNDIKISQAIMIGMWIGLANVLENDGDFAKGQEVANVFDRWDIGMDSKEAPQGREAGSKLKLDALKRRVMNSQCQDPRDMVFGILRLVDWGRAPSIRPSYNMTKIELGEKLLECYQDEHTEIFSCLEFAACVVHNLHLNLDDPDVTRAVDARHTEADDQKRNSANIADRMSSRRLITENNVYWTCELFQSHSNGLAATLSTDLKTIPEDELVDLRKELEKWGAMVNSAIAVKCRQIFLDGEPLVLLCEAAEPKDHLLPLRGLQASHAPIPALVLRKRRWNVYAIVGQALIRPDAKVQTASIINQAIASDQGDSINQLGLQLCLEAEDLIYLAAIYSSVAQRADENVIK